jgi:uncharacterized protein YbjT (DUF2867 family)
MTVLVIGASGNIGRHVVRELVKRDVEVAAFIREPADDIPSDSPLSYPRVRRVQGDLSEPDSVCKAAVGCTAVFILAPHSPDQVALQNAAVDAAADAGAKVVTLSSWGPAVHQDSPVPGARRHWITQQYILKRQLPYTFLQPNYFMQALLNRYAAEVRQRGVLVSPAGNRGVSMVDARDVAEVAARTLIEPGHDGQTYVLSGPSAPTYHQIALTLTNLTGRKVISHDLSDDEFTRWMADEGRQPWEPDHAAAIFRLYNDGTGELVTDHVEQVIARPPRTIEEFLAEHRSRFLPATGLPSA